MTVPLRSARKIAWSAPPGRPKKSQKRSNTFFSHAGSLFWGCAGAPPGLRSASCVKSSVENPSHGGKNPPRPRSRANTVAIAAAEATHCIQEELLFSPYSSFHVQAVEWSDQPIWSRPHRIHIFAYPDNRGVSEEVPLAPWS